ncbi:tetratricopeptide repeat protein [Pseudoalteromonas xiamenensis]|uniref:tetratricopeptide repeat protein n=1 Tax=Pseudoalteromonas xiamenensis TaxID=882626 RepID=UPI0027E47D3A|nr:tetratricopeptide repeat protein [Pseudoalteromonas xiamenensis]WMN58985.1 tetratricopeptide repeat protein [Pseudoalteromonas xiamenensis]
MSDRNVTVQGSTHKSIIITGNNNQVGGQAEFNIPLTCYHHQTKRRRSNKARSNVLDILNAQNRAVELYGRESELKRLTDWLDDDADISVFTLIAPAGSGKTRLAIELCEITERDNNWACGFVRHIDLDELARAFKFTHFTWSHSLLLVVDYAAVNYQGLADWLDALSQLEELAPNIKLRILLLEREANKDMGWWKHLVGSSLNSHQSRLDFFYHLEPYPLAGLSDLTVRHALIHAAFNATKSLFADSQAHPPPKKNMNPEFDKVLSRAQFTNPLTLVMAGVLCHDMPLLQALNLNHLEAAQKIALREIDRFNTYFNQGNNTELEHGLCFHLLTGGLRLEDMRQALNDEFESMGYTRNKVSDALVSLQQTFSSTTPQNEGHEELRLTTIQPDLISEAICVQLLNNNSERKVQAANIVERALRYGNTHAASMLIRLLQDFASSLNTKTAGQRDVQVQLQNWVTQLITDNQNDLNFLRLIESVLPDSSVTLAGISCHLLAAICHIFRERVANDEDFQPDFAMSLNNLASFQSELGHREAALEHALEAVQIYRKLAEAHPDTFLPDLAMSLNNLASFQSELGQREAALEHALEAVNIRRKLAEAHPDTFLPNLAGSLNNLANRLSELGQREAALEHALEAVQIYRKLAEAHPDTFLPDLAMSLNNLASFQSELGQREAALEHALEAVNIRRKLAEAHPDTFLPNLAGSLNNLANRLSELGQREAALEHALEAVNIRRKLAEAHPDTFLPDLAMSLNNLANRLSELGQREAALEHALEAVNIRRKLAEAHPDTFLPNLAGSLNNLANRLSELGQREAALEHALEAVNIRRKLAEAHPDTFLPDLAGSLNNLASFQSELGQREAALEHALEAIESLIMHFLNYPKAYSNWMEALLRNYLKYCEQTESEPDARLLSPIIEVLKQGERK